MGATTTVGLRPWLPRPLSRWAWWTEPVPAERLAALRVGVASVLLVDIFVNYLPHAHVLFGPNSLGGPEVFLGPSAGWPWSSLADLTDGRAVAVALAAWVALAGLLLAGRFARLAALGTWLLSQAFLHLNPLAHNGGDTVRTILLFYLMLSPCGAAWSLNGRRLRADKGFRVCVYPWALRLLFLQMVLIYFFNGVHKLRGAEWQAGNSLHYVLADLTLTRISYAQLPAPEWLTRLCAWAVLAWEVSFPLLVYLPSTRTAALLAGVALHVGIGLSLELGVFSLYMLCLYLPLVPWEK